MSNVCAKCFHSFATNALFTAKVAVGLGFPAEQAEMGGHTPLLAHCKFNVQCFKLLRTMVFARSLMSEFAAQITSSNAHHARWHKNALYK